LRARDKRAAVTMPCRTSVALAALIALGLAGCGTAADLRRMDEARCLDYGFQQGTPDFAACLQRESLARRYPPPYWGPDLRPGYPRGFWP
jgi:hypothetical protein